MTDHDYSKIKCLLWDNDGVLVDTEQFYYEAGKQVLTEHGITLTYDHFIEHSLRRGASVFDVARERGVPETECTAMRDRRDAIYTQLVRTEDLFIPGVEDVVARIAPHFRMCIVSSSHKVNFDAIHARTGTLLSHFEFQLLNGDYPRSKPNPDPWLTAATRLGARPDECLVIEDSPRGIIAAQAAHMRAIALSSKFFSAKNLDPYLTEGDLCVAHIHDLPRVLGL